MIKDTKLTIVENGKCKNIIIKPYVRYVKTSYSDRVKATRVGIPHSKCQDTKGNYYILRIFSTKKGLIQIKDNDDYALYESKYTLKQFNELRYGEK